MQRHRYKGNPLFPPESLTVSRGICLTKQALLQAKAGWVDSHPRPLEALRWFVITEEAKQMLEDLGVRDLAEMLETGIKPIPKTFKGLVVHILEAVDYDEDYFAGQLKDLVEFYIPFYTSK